MNNLLIKYVSAYNKGKKYINVIEEKREISSQHTELLLQD